MTATESFHDEPEEDRTDETDETTARACLESYTTHYWSAAEIDGVHPGVPWLQATAQVRPGVAALADGVRRLLDVAPRFTRTPEVSIHIVDDCTALTEDWETVGADQWRAFLAVMRSLPAEERYRVAGTAVVRFKEAFGDLLNPDGGVQLRLNVDQRG